MKKRLFWWIPPWGWAVFIFVNSHMPADESSQASGLVTWLINRVLGLVGGMGHITVTEFFVRKLAHFSEYFILGLLLCIAIAQVTDRVRALYLTVLVGSVYAATDEIHQHFIPGRVMSSGDVAIDTAGVLCGAFLLYCVLHRMCNKKEEEQRKKGNK